MTRLGIGLRGSTFTHLVLHAFFKALLFMAVGVAIHAQYGSQESRCTVYFTYVSPLTLSCIYLSLLSLCGFCFISGWVSKDNILECFISSSASWLGFFLFYISIGITVQYSLRVVHNLNSATLSFSSLSCQAGPNSACIIPLLLLSSISVFAGYFFSSRLRITCPVLILTDKLIVVFVMFLAACASRTDSKDLHRDTPLLSTLFFVTNLFSKRQSGFSLFYSLERSPVSRLYLERMPLAAQSTSLSKLVYLRSIVLISSLFLLIY